MSARLFRMNSSAPISTVLKTKAAELYPAIASGAHSSGGVQIFLLPFCKRRAKIDLLKE